MLDIAKSLRSLDQEKIEKILAFFDEQEKFLVNKCGITTLKRDRPIPPNDPIKRLDEMYEFWKAKKEKISAEEMKDYLLERLFHLARYRLDNGKNVYWDERDKKNSIFTYALKLVGSDGEKFMLMCGELVKENEVGLSEEIFDYVPRNFNPILLHYIVLKNLLVKKLKLGKNNFTSLRILEGFMNFTELSLGRNNIKSLVQDGAEYAAYLINIEKLNLGDNKIEDISPLMYSTNIEGVVFGEKQNKDVRAIKECYHFN